MGIAASPGRRRRSLFIAVGQVAVAVVLLVLVWRLADGAEALRLLGSATPVFLVLAFGALTTQTVFSALRWQLTARELGLRLSAGTAIREYYLSQIVNQTLPGGVLGDAGRAFRARKLAGLLSSGQSVVFERLAGQIGLLTVMVATFLVQFATQGSVDWPQWLGVIVGSVFAGIVAVVVAFGLLARTGGGLGQQASHLAGLLRAVWFASGVWWRQLVYSLATALLNITAFWLCALALGAEFSITEALVLVPLILFTMLIPVTVSGWGVREGAAAALFPLVGALPSEGLATSVAFGLLFLASALPGAAFVRARPESTTP